MARDHNRSRLLRQLADCLMSQVPEELLTSPRPDLSTSLVRQWLTYDNHATLILGKEQHYYRPNLGPGGELRFDSHRVPVDAWFQQAMREYEFGEEERRKAVRQLNLGQCAQVENRRGEFVRLWVNPRDRSKGLERLGTSRPAPRERNLAVIAQKQIEAIFGGQIGSGEKEDLVAALVRQWELYDLHALILTPRAKYQIVLALKPGGMTEVTTRALGTSLPRKLLVCGVAPEDVPRFLHVLNLGLRPEIIDDRGRRCRVLTDPKNADVYMNVVPPPQGLTDLDQQGP